MQSLHLICLRRRQLIKTPFRRSHTQTQTQSLSPTSAQRCCNALTSNQSIVAQPEIAAIGPFSKNKQNRELMLLSLTNPWNGNYSDTMWHEQSDTDFSVNSNIFGILLTGCRCHSPTLRVYKYHLILIRGAIPITVLKCASVSALTRLGLRINYATVTLNAAVKYATRTSR